MSEKKNLDEFLRDTLNRLPNTPVGNFNAVEKRIQTKKNQSILVLLLIPFLLSGLYWMGSFTEKDVYFEPDKQIVLPTNLESAPEKSIKKSNVEVTKSENQSSKAATQNHPRSASKMDVQNQVSYTQNAISAAAQNSTILFVEEESAVTILAGKQVTNAGVEQNGAAKTSEIRSVEYLNSDEVARSKKALVEGFQSETTNNSTSYLAEDVRETSRWSVTMNFYPNYTFREFSVKPAYQSKVNSRYEEIINESEKGGYAFNAGVDVKYHLGKNVFIGSGLSFIQTKIGGNYNFEIYTFYNVGKNDNVISEHILAKPIIINQGIVQTYQFLQVPLHVSYQPWVSKKLRLTVEGGLSYIRFLRADGKTIDYRSLAVRELNTMPFNENITSFDFKVGVSYYTTPKVAFGLEPTLMYFSKSIYAANCPIDVVPWSVGVNFNVRVRLY